MKVSIWQKDMDVIGGFAQALGAPTPSYRDVPIYAAAQSTGYGAANTAATCAVRRWRAQAGQAQACTAEKA